MQKNMEIETFKDVLSSIKNLKHISIQGEGEPLLHPHFFDMVKIVEMEHPQAKVSFITNGSLFSNENISKILSSNVHKILVSIESPKPEDFRDIRGGKLEKVLAGISALLSERKMVKKSHPTVGFAVTILRKTINDYKSIIPLYHKLGMDGGMTFQLLQKMSVYSEIYGESMSKELLSLEDVIFLQSEAVSESELFNTIKQNADEPNFYEDLFSSKSHGCPWLSNGLYVNTNGVATGCCLIKDADTEGFGVVNTSSAQSVLHMRDEFHAKLFSGLVPKVCQDCAIATLIQRRMAAH